MRVKARALGIGVALALGFLVLLRAMPTRIAKRPAPGLPQAQQGPTLDAPPPKPPDALRLVLVRSDGTACPRARYVLVAPGDERHPVAEGETDERGIVDITLAAPLPLRLLAYKRFDAAILWADVPVEERVGMLRVTLPQEARVDGTMVEEDGRAIANGVVRLSLGWRGGMEDRLYGIFNQLVGKERSLELRTDATGRFTLHSVPLAVFFGFQQFASERGTWRYRVGTDLQRHRATCYVAREAATYHVTITRIRNPVLHLTVHCPTHVCAAEVRAAARIQRDPTDRSDNWTYAGLLTKDGVFECPIGLGDSDDPVSLSGRAAWVALYHPAVGVTLDAWSLDGTTWRRDVQLAPPAGARSIQGMVTGESRPDGLEVVLKSELFLGMELARLPIDESMKFRIDGLVIPPEGWPVEPDETIYRVEFLRNGREARTKSTSNAKVQFDTPTTFELVPDDVPK